ncbi:uncharacterized protein LOC115766212 [Drosophila novamexicana]|uniref:uncharacterized protein LOC115766212 n=1 Tax=Drosophila novamexicana TaxID=47314 RepID=UPI0011E5ECB7|nr:uncharacterized protein LOC115766212 [Drosophila novamexicana]
MPYLYGVTDTKYRFKEDTERSSPVLNKFQYNTLLTRRVQFGREEWPLPFRATPASLVELCVNVADKLPLPSVFEWNDMDIRLWITRYGYPQYMNTFRVNMIWGRKLLLLDADALSAMNIKDFDHIKHITYGIRMLFHFELTKFSHSISLPDEKPNELYLLWHTQTGLNYDAVRRSDLYRRMQLIRERSPYLDHWDMLDMWLRRERERKYSELIALVPRYKLYTCKETPEKSTSQTTSESGFDNNHCRTCLPPCECWWTERDTLLPWRLSYLNPGKGITHSAWMATEKQCVHCIPPCECRWLSRYYLTGTVISCLKNKFPEKFAPIFDATGPPNIRASVMVRWTRFSI